MQMCTLSVLGGMAKLQSQTGPQGGCTHIQEVVILHHVGHRKTPNLQPDEGSRVRKSQEDLSDSSGHSEDTYHTPTPALDSVSSSQSSVCTWGGRSFPKQEDLSWFPDPLNTSFLLFLPDHPSRFPKAPCLPYAEAPYHLSPNYEQNHKGTSHIPGS